MEDPKVATEEECREYHRKCWWRDCKNTAWSHNSMGWNYCPKHVLYLWKVGELKLKMVGLRWPY